MVSYKTSRIIPIILTLVIIAIAIAALVSLARVVFFSGNTNETVIDTSREALLSTSADSSVRMTVRGAIVANEEFRSYQINITPNSRTLTTYTSYLDRPIDTIALDNNKPAYEEFVFALDKANLVRGDQLEGDDNDLRGICATGRVYEFQVLKAGEPVKQLWTSTCKGSSGSLEASVDQLTNLFTSQIPDARSLISKLDL
ncbi:MAG TPA: hypothetical protein VFS65_02030 [Candidatus Saccharimonadales bacterium]|nr:hypothetical protein [Candidatus Saccharimonadales bacterium]